MNRLPALPRALAAAAGTRWIDLVTLFNGLITCGLLLLVWYSSGAAMLGSSSAQQVIGGGFVQTVIVQFAFWPQQMKRSFAP